jgi:dGTPase
MDRPDLLPGEWAEDVARAGASGAEAHPNMARIVADYVAGMTDRFAIQEYDRLIGAPTRP